MNYYEILEVSPAASPEVIRAAYKSLMQRYHPDRNPDDASAAVRATRVVQAYEVLSDAERRAAYDRELQADRVALEVALLRPAGGSMGRGLARAPEAGAGRGGGQFPTPSREAPSTGTSKPTTAPPSAALPAKARPPCSWATCSTMARPKPEPGVVRAPTAR